ncbi:SPOR domain-containing protein [Bartonella sp. DGB1]|uniref:SPOR domain-containing protein n=1 Tax=Bartonella sp. DGB1 TaxID=3239807 RepID=UPI003525BD7B
MNNIREFTPEVKQEDLDNSFREITRKFMGDISKLSTNDSDVLNLNNLDDNLANSESGNYSSKDFRAVKSLKQSSNLDYNQQKKSEILAEKLRLFSEKRENIRKRMQEIRDCYNVKKEIKLDNFAPVHIVNSLTEDKLAFSPSQEDENLLLPTNKHDENKQLTYIDEKKIDQDVVRLSCNIRQNLSNVIKQDQGWIGLNKYPYNNECLYINPAVQGDQAITKMIDELDINLRQLLEEESNISKDGKKRNTQSDNFNNDDYLKPAVANSETMLKEMSPPIVMTSKVYGKNIKAVEDIIMASPLDNYDNNKSVEKEILSDIHNDNLNLTRGSINSDYNFSDTNSVRSTTGFTQREHFDDLENPSYAAPSIDQVSSPNSKSFSNYQQDYHNKISNDLLGWNNDKDFVAVQQIFNKKPIKKIKIFTRLRLILLVSIALVASGIYLFYNKKSNDFVVIESKLANVKVVPQVNMETSNEAGSIAYNQLEGQEVSQRQDNLLASQEDLNNIPEVPAYENVEDTDAIISSLPGHLAENTDASKHNSPPSVFTNNNSAASSAILGGNTTLTDITPVNIAASPAFILDNKDEHSNIMPLERKVVDFSLSDEDVQQMDTNNQSDSESYVDLAEDVPLPINSVLRGVANAPFYVQIASLTTEAEADTALNQLISRYRTILQGHRIIIQESEVAGKGVYYRLRVPLNSYNEAQTFCDGYRQAGGSCFVVSQ